MNIFNGLLATVLLTVFIVLVLYQLRKLKTDIIAVKDGDLSNKRLVKMIKEAENSGKYKFTFFMPIAYGVLYSCLFVLLMYISEIFFFKKNISIYSMLFLFLFTLVFISIWGVIVARKIWSICR